MLQQLNVESEKMKYEESIRKNERSVSPMQLQKMKLIYQRYRIESIQNGIFNSKVEDAATSPDTAVYENER